MKSKLPVAGMTPRVHYSIQYPDALLVVFGTCNSLPNVTNDIGKWDVFSKAGCHFV